MDLVSADAGAKKESPFKDRRIFARLAAKLPLRYLHMDSCIRREAQSLDISARGIGIYTNERLSENSFLKIWLMMPENDIELPMRGRVAWSRETEPSKYRAGIKLEKTELMEMAVVLRKITARQDIAITGSCS